MNTLESKRIKRLSEQLLEAQAILQELASLLSREWEALKEAQKLLREPDRQLRLF